MAGAGCGLILTLTLSYPCFSFFTSSGSELALTYSHKRELCITFYWVMRTPL